MRGNAELVSLRSIYSLITVSILVFSFAGFTTGSCLSYGHSCWGAHGKRSHVQPQENFAANDKRTAGPSSLGERLLLSRLVNRQLMQIPLVNKLRAQMLAEQLPLSALSESLDEGTAVSPNTEVIKHSTTVENPSRDVNIRELSKGDESTGEELESSNVLLIPRHQEFSNDGGRALNLGLYRFIKSVNEKLK